MKVFPVIFWLIACLSASVSFGQKPLQYYFDTITRMRQLNGNLLVAENGRVVLNGSAGFAAVRTGEPNQPDSRFNLASISKLFTATAILQLRDKRKVSLEDEVTDYLPDFPFKNITIRHLLTHTSGLPDLELFELLVRQFPDTVVTNRDIIPQLRKWSRGLYFTPGERFAYCNIGYCLLAMIIEKVSGMSYGAYVTRAIFKPAGMTDSYVSNYPDHGWQMDNRCIRMHVRPHPYYDSTYADVDSVPRHRYTSYNCSGLTGSANIVTTTGDLMKFDMAFFGYTLLKPSTASEALTPARLNNGQVAYETMDTILGDGKMTTGLGWEIFDQPDFGISVGHGGFMFGLATFYFHRLDGKQVLIGFDNTAGSEFGRIMTSALSLLNGKAALAIRNKQSLAFVYGSTLVKAGSDAAACALNIVKDDTLHYYMSEWELNQLGGSLLYGSSFDGHRQLALEVFKLNTFLFPQSFNVYGSYGDGLREMGKRREAVLMYEKAVSLNPQDEDDKASLKALQ